MCCKKFISHKLNPPFRFAQHPPLIKGVMKSLKFKPSLLKRVADRVGDFSVLYKKLFGQSTKVTILYSLRDKLYIVQDSLYTLAERSRSLKDILFHLYNTNV